jgi:hypothetical protein
MDEVLSVDTILGTLEKIDADKPSVITVIMTKLLVYSMEC